jgi:hypothetical protein
MADRRQATRWRVGGGALLPTDFRINYENATKSNFQITLKNSTEVEKQKLLNFSNPTTLSITTFSNSA